MAKKDTNKEKNTAPLIPEEDRIIKTEYSELMQKSFIDYAMSVIVARALPDIRDGLKPVQRRVLYSMNELGIRSDRPHRKSARIVGDTMGKYHPHGDSSIYDSLVVMAQDFKKEVTLVDGHGNFGNIEGDSAAAMRYTEARLEKLTEDAFLADLDKDVVDFVPNFDETEKEPSVLPVRIPHFLINGSEGIAVGMTTSTPPHNLAEAIDAQIAYLDHPELTTRELMQYIKGPDFPTGGIVVNESDLGNQPRTAHRPGTPIRAVHHAGRTPDVGVVMGHPASSTIHRARRLPTCHAEVVDEVKQRLRKLAEIAHLGRPIIHLSIDIDRVLAVPRCQQVFVPQALQPGSLTVGL